VTSIGQQAFSHCNLSSVTIPNSITSIGGWAFSGCDNLESIVIPNSVITIGGCAFEGCRNLSSISIGNGLNSVGDFAFQNCNKLNSVHITDIGAWSKISFSEMANPLSYAQHFFLNGQEINDVIISDTINTIGTFAFHGWRNLNTVVISNGVTSIEHGAFEGCSNLKSVTIQGNSITTIGDQAFMDCKSLTDICIPNNITSLGVNAFAGCSGISSINIPIGITTIADGTFADCYGLRSIVIPNGVTSIEQNAFIRCKNLTSVTISQSVVEISANAFSECSELSDVYCFAESVPKTHGSNPFQDSRIEYATLHVPAASVSSYEAIEPWKNFKTIVKIDMPKHILVYIVDGEEYKKYEIEEGTSIISEAAPTKEGYTFSGWSEIPEMMPAHDVTVNGSFIVNKYKVTYILDGEMFATNNVEYGTAIVTPTVEEKDGYTFSGWADVPETMPAHDITIYGNFTSGIAEISIDNEAGTIMYTFNGKRINRLQRGVNIVRTSNGKVKKVIVK